MGNSQTRCDREGHKWKHEAKSGQCTICKVAGKHTEEVAWVCTATTMLPSAYGLASEISECGNTQLCGDCYAMHSKKCVSSPRIITFPAETAP
jgi:hypothetical protein